ncbi:hypothetical protein B7L30_021715, partial [Burkholderia cenocepacia]|nr:hypothetical protein [Burkholderia cenocepacia]
MGGAARKNGGGGGETGDWTGPGGDAARIRHAGLVGEEQFTPEGELEHDDTLSLPAALQQHGAAAG